MKPEDMLNEANKHFAAIRIAAVRREITWTTGSAPEGAIAYHGSVAGYMIVVIKGQGEPDGAVTTAGVFSVIHLTPEMALFCFECADKSADAQRQVDQLTFNCEWLRERIDEAHEALCTGQRGTWQQRAEQVVKAAQEIAQGRVAKAQLAVPTGAVPNPLEERRKCDRCERTVTAEEWAHCGHPNCYAFFNVLPVVTTVACRGCGKPITEEHVLQWNSYCDDCIETGRNFEPPTNGNPS